MIRTTCTSSDPSHFQVHWRHTVHHYCRLSYRPSSLHSWMGLLAACIPACVWVVLKLGLDLSIDNVAFQHLRRISPYLCLNTQQSLEAMGLPWKSTNYSSNHHSSQHKDQCIGHCIYDDIFTTLTWLTPEVSINHYLNEIFFLKWWA